MKLSERFERLLPQGKSTPSPSLRGAASKGAAARSNALTVMLLHRSGKVRSFHLTYPILTVVTLILMLWVSCTVLLLHRHREERLQSRTQSELLEQLKGEAEEVRRDVYEARQHLALLQDFIHKMGTQPREADTLAPKKAGQPDTALSGTQKEPRVETAPPTPPVPVVSVNDLALERTSSELKVSYKLINVERRKGPTSGYAHTIAVMDGSEAKELVASPPVALKDGIPVNFQLGQRFSINNYRTIRCRYPLHPGSPPPSVLRVFIYNETGVLILQREFSIEVPSENSTG